MRSLTLAFLALFLSITLQTPLVALAENSPDLAWPEPVTENRPGCYWWWMGSAVDKENLTWNLETLREAGMGGVSIIPIYGVKGYEDRYLEFLSPAWVEMLSFATKEAQRLGMWADMTTGTGWPFGGPMITEEEADATAVYEGGVLSQKFSGRMVKRAAPGGVGMAVNPYSAKVMADYLKHFDGPLGAEGVVLPRAQYHDSFEFLGNWCPELPQEFKRRRGYDLLEHLPELFGEGDPETVARIKSDYRETLSDLHLDYLEVWVKWSAEKGCTTRNQAHGSPSNLLDLYAASGIPETEIFGASVFQIPEIRLESENVDGKNHPQPLINRMASSAAHVMDKNLVASETCTWIRNHFKTALSQAKPEIDQLFLCGINHIFIHGTCYSPKEAPWPGWLFYASMEYNPRNAIWRDAPFLNEYITRCQSILQSGNPDNPVALYWPVHDIWHSHQGMQQRLTVHEPAWLNESKTGEAATWLVEQGYGFDYISDRQLLAGKAEPYQAVLVPKTEHIPLETLKSLLSLADQGKPVIFLEELPRDVPGFQDLEARRAELQNLLKGRESLVAQTEDLLNRLKKTPAEREPMVDSGLDFIRRTHETGHHFFIANMGAGAVDAWIPLGVPFTGVAILDPRSGQVGVATQRDRREVYLQLRPGETRILRTFRDKKIEGPAWPLLQPTGGEPHAVTGRWKVEFLQGDPVIPASFETDELKSWTVLGDEEAGRFAGTAKYSIEFTLPEAEADDWVLDLGEVRESARVFLNGQPAAKLWSVPFEASVGEFLQPGINLLEIEVTNLSANRLRDLDVRGVEWKIFHDANIVDHNYKPFDASGWELTPSGLLGPVRLMPMEKLTVH
jgi:hypothetical protein